MISIKKDRFIKIIKTLSLLFLALIVFFFLKEIYISISNKTKIEELTVLIEQKKSHNNKLQAQINDYKIKYAQTLKAYPTTEEIEEKLKEIFKRMSILDYELMLLGTKKMCIDRHILVSRLDAKSDEGRKAALGILNYLGKIKQSDKDGNVYFIDFISTKKGEK